MRHFSETIEIARPPHDVWRAIGTPGAGSSRASRPARSEP